MQTTLNAAFGEALRRAAVVPVLTVENASAGVGLAQALVSGGLDMIEVTLRTPAAIDVIRQVRAEVPAVRIGAGTVLTPNLAERAIGAGARFIVSPGMTPRLLEAAQGWPVPFLPGAATASEAMALADLGYRVLKFFPAGPAGGIPYLKALAAPLPDVAFCPTGGIDESNAEGYLALPNVVAVGGSWVAPAASVQAANWPSIAALAARAAAFKPRA